MSKDPTQKYSKEINKIISKCKTISNAEKYKLKMINPSTPKFRGQPKVHKIGIPIRPVVNYRIAPAYNVCKFLNYKLQKKTNINTNYSIPNTYQLVQNIKNFTIPENSIFLII
jgi:hypothetical protein